MKVLRVVLLSILSIFIATYLAFLFVLPNAIDLNKYSPQVTKIIRDYSGYEVDIKGLKIKTEWDLSVGAHIEKADLKYTTGEKFAQINNLQIKLSLIPLLRKKIQINKIEADKVLANIKSEKTPLSPVFSLKMSRKTQKTPYIIFSTKLPDFSVKKYRISLINGKNNYTLKGTGLKISDFILNEKIKLKTSGNLILNKRPQIAYNIAICSDSFPKGKNKATDLIKIFDDLYKYNVKANINTNLNIKNDNINGKIDVDKISFIFANKIYPQSNLKLAFKGNNAKINASLHVNKNSKAIITGLFKTGKNKFIDLHVITDKTDIEDLLLITKAMSRPFGVKNLHDFEAKGLLKANFDVKSDLKKIESRGFLKIKNASIKNKKYNVILNALNADIDFSQDSVHIKQAKANMNGQPINIEGSIDRKAIANISVFAKHLQLKGVLLALGNSNILKENEIISGIIDIKGNLAGRLNKAVPKINAIITNVNLKNIPSKTQIKLANAYIKSEKNINNVELNGLKAYPQAFASISVPKLNLNVNNNDLTIKQTTLYLDNIRTNICGKISNIQTAPRLNSVTISIPNQISAPIKGYQHSKIIAKGSLNLNGNIYKPEITGNLAFPTINIPSISTNIQNANLKFNKKIILSAPNTKIANSQININAEINKDFSNGIIVQSINFIADNIDLNNLIPIIKTQQSANTPPLTILNGKSTISKFKVGAITSSNITSAISMKNNVLFIKDIFSDAYNGKIAGDISYDFTHRKTNLNLQGRELTANLTLIALTGRDDDIHGQLDFDSDISMSGFTKNDLLKSLNGETNFIIHNGKMGLLGKFEHLLYAQNILSNNIFKATLNVVAKAVTVKNTGVYKYMKGKVLLSNGWANINQVKTSGPSMSLYITGRCYLPDDTANLTILGRISDDVVKILGPIGEFSMNKAISYIPKLGEITAFFANQYTSNPNYENISEIPDLYPKTEFKTKEFKVIIDGDIRKQSAVKSFKWLSKPGIVQPQNETFSSTQKPAQANTSLEIPDFVKKLPEYKQ